MELEKSNETVWSIKRRGQEGKFILRSTEQAGDIIRVSISLVENERVVTFDMKHPEFINFYGIISSFKALIESSDHLQARQSSVEEIQMIKPEKAEKITVHSSTPHKSDVNPIQTTPSSPIDDKQAKLDEGLKNLEDFFSDIHFENADETEGIAELDKTLDEELASQEESPKKSKSLDLQEMESQIPPSIISPQPPTPQTHPGAESVKNNLINALQPPEHSKSGSKSTSKKQKLKETDWDPW